MLRGISAAGLGTIGSEEQLMELAARYGFHSVDLDARSLVDRMGAEAAAERLQSLELTVGAIGLPVEWRGSEAVFRESLKGLPASAEAAAALGCTRCCTYILPSTDEPAARFMAVAVARLRVIAGILGAYGIRLGLEFVGPHHLRTAWKHPFIWTLEETLDMISAIHEPNVGVLLDAYHWHTTGMSDEDIARLRADQIVHVHINDARDVPVEQLLDNDRLYPGEGVIDLGGFLKGLHTIGYTGPVAQEILTPAPTADSPEALAGRSRDGFDKVFKAAGLV